MEECGIVTLISHLCRESGAQYQEHAHLMKRYSALSSFLSVFLAWVQIPRALGKSQYKYTLGIY